MKLSCKNKNELIKRLTRLTKYNYKMKIFPICHFRSVKLLFTTNFSSAYFFYSPTRFMFKLFTQLTTKVLAMDFILKQLYPLQSISYLNEYFEQRRKLADDFSNRSSRKNFKFAAIDFLLTLQAAHFLYQYCKKFSPLEIVLHGDYATVACVTREAYIPVAGLCLLSAYILHRLYLPVKKDDAILRLLYSVLIEQRNVGFISDQTVINGISRFSLVILNIFNQFGGIIFVFCLTTQIVLVFDLLKIGGADFLRKPFYLAVLVVTELRLVALYAVLYLFAHAHILLATLWIVSLRLISTKLKLLCKLSSSNLGLCKMLVSFKTEYTKTLFLVLSANRFFSPVLLLFLAINCPLNGLLVSLLILGRVPLLKAAFVGPVALEEFIFIFGIHLLIANVNKKVHRPVVAVVHRLFMEQVVQQLSVKVACSKSIIHLKMSLFIQSLAFTRKKHGFSYGNFGRISLMGFVKYQLLYSQLLMFVIKMV